MLASGVPVADLVELGRSVVRGLRDGRFVISLDAGASGALMEERARRIGRGELPTVPRASVFER
jgi:hypothetical protein